MPVTMGGVASGMDTDAIIEKLVNVESQPIKVMQRDIAVNQSRKAALEALSARLKELERSAKELYGFRAAYNDKLVTSSNPGVISATGSKLADKGTKTVEVIETASSHVIATDELPDDTSLPSGKFIITLDGEVFRIRFKGGSLKALHQKIDEAVGERISTSLVKTSGGRSTLILSSKVSGKKGEMLLSGDMPLLNSIGLAGRTKAKETIGADINFDRSYFSTYTGRADAEEQYGLLQVADNGKSISLTGISWQEYRLPVNIAGKKDTAVEFSLSYKPKEAEPEEAEKDTRLMMGPEETTVVQGIELKGYNIQRVRPDIKKAETEEFDSLLGVGIVSEDNKGKRTERIYPVNAGEGDSRKIELGRDFAGKSIASVIFYCNEGAAEFSGVRISASAEMGVSYEPKNVVVKASDARLKVDGIEIVREKNTDLTDVIKGVTLNIHSASSAPVTLQISQTIENAVDKIRAFVEAYNNYIDLNAEITKAERTENNKPGEFEKNRNKNGLFVGDLAIIRLENTLSAAVGAAYQSPADKPIRTFSEMGVSTGKINSAWNTIKYGKLVIDEELLKRTITENPEGVRMFFGYDSDGDKREDSGMACTVNKHLEAYIGPGRNVISTKINLENENIKATNDRIAKKEEHIKQYEDKLRRKFSAMEETMSGANAQKSWMNQQMGGNSSNGK